MATIAVSPEVSTFAPTFNPAFGNGEVAVKSMESLSDKTVFLKTRFGVLGNSRKVTGDVLQTDADKSLLSVSKLLLDSKELAEIKRQDMNMRKWLENVCLPYDIGISLLPIGLIETVNNKLTEYKAKRDELVNLFVEAYPALIESAAMHLGSLYATLDYPSVEDVRARFNYSWDYISFGVPGSLAHVSPSLYAAQAEKAQQQMQDAAAEITQLMRETLAEMVAHLADKLSPGDEGKPKILRETAVTNLQEFLDTFNFRNVTNDTELAEQVEKARALVSGVSASGLRSNETWRETIRAGMSGISDTLSGMVEEKSGRKFRS